jgi:hypothetical protein
VASQEGLCFTKLVNAAVIYFYALFISENLLMPIKFPNGRSTVSAYLFIYLFIYLFPVHLTPL